MSKEYEKVIRVAFHESNDALRVTIPKKIKFCATVVHTYFRDTRTLVVSPNRTAQTQHSATMITKNQTSGCVEFTLPHVQHVGIGDHFGITPVESYHMEEGDIIVTFPSLSNRRPAQIRNKKSSIAKPAADEPSGTVKINVYENDIEFIVPQAELFELVMAWQAKGYNAT